MTVVPILRDEETNATSINGRRTWIQFDISYAYLQRNQRLRQLLLVLSELHCLCVVSAQYQNDPMPGY
jgi:hypothetical protein